MKLTASKSIRWLLTLLVAVGASIIFWTLIIMIFEEHFIYFPAVYPEGMYEAESRVLHPEDHWFETGDGVKLHGWYLRSPDSLGTILFFHGNAGNLSHRGEILRRLHATGFNVFIFDYRGYGRSEGTPNESGVYADGFAAAKYIKTLKGVDSARLFYLGSSLGGAVAIDAATRQSPTALILESTFSSARDVARSAYPFLPTQFLLRTKFDSETKIRTLRIPLLFFHGTDDSIIPYHLGRKLFQAANFPKEFVDIPGADHNDLFFVGGNDYLMKIRTFCIQSSGKALL